MNVNKICELRVLNFRRLGANPPGKAQISLSSSSFSFLTSKTVKLEDGGEDDWLRRQSRRGFCGSYYQGHIIS